MENVKKTSINRSNAARRRQVHADARGARSNSCQLAAPSTTRHRTRALRCQSAINQDGGRRRDPGPDHPTQTAPAVQSCRIVQTAESERRLHLWLLCLSRRSPPRRLLRLALALRTPPAAARRPKAALEEIRHRQTAPLSPQSSPPPRPRPATEETESDISKMSYGEGASRGLLGVFLMA